MNIFHNYVLFFCLILMVETKLKTKRYEKNVFITSNCFIGNSGFLQ